MKEECQYELFETKDRVLMTRGDDTFATYEIVVDVPAISGVY